MKILIILIFSFSPFQLFCQDIDSLGNNHLKSVLREKYQIQNTTDSIGLKQGLWTHYYMQTICNCFYSVGVLRVAKEPSPEVVFQKKSRGHYLNDKKIGEWTYFDNGSDFNTKWVRTEFLSNEGELLKTVKTISQNGRQIDIVNDSSEVFIHLRTRNYDFLINCNDRQCECLLENKKLYEFNIEKLNLEMDKLEAGVYNRRIIHNVKIDPYD